MSGPAVKASGTAASTARVQLGFAQKGDDVAITIRDYALDDQGAVVDAVDDVLYTTDTGMQTFVNDPVWSRNPKATPKVITKPIPWADTDLLAVSSADYLASDPAAQKLEAQWQATQAQGIKGS